MSVPLRRIAPLSVASTPDVPVPAPARVKIDAFLWSLMLFSWVAVWRIQDIFPILGKIKFPLLIQAVTILLFFNDSTPQRRIEYIKSPILWCVLGIFALMILGLPFSLYKGYGFTFITRDFLPSFVLMVLLATSFRESSDLDWFAFVYMIGAAIYAFVVFQNFEIGPSGRLGGLVYYDSNDFGLLLVTTLPFTIYFLRPGVPTLRRLVALGTMGLCVIMIIRSGSRGAFLGLIAVAAYILFRYRAVPTKFRVGAVISGAVLLLTLGSSTYWEMMATLLNPKDDYNMQADVGRSAVWKRGIGYMFTRPVFGVGVRAFPQAEGLISDISKRYAERGAGIKWSVAHNSFVEIGAELGVIGLVLFLLIFFYAIRTLLRVGGPRGSPTDTPNDSAFAQMLVASFVGFIVSGFFVSAEYFSHLYVLLAMVLGQQAVLNRRATHQHQHQQNPQTGVTKSQRGSPKQPSRIPPPRPMRTPWVPSGT